MRGVAAERFCVRNSGVTAVVEVSTVFTAIFTIRLLCSVYPVYFPFFFPASLVPFFVVCKITINPVKSPSSVAMVFSCPVQVKFTADSVLNVLILLLGCW